jgi:hypothetical protein
MQGALQLHGVDWCNCRAHRQWQVVSSIACNEPVAEFPGYLGLSYAYSVRESTAAGSRRCSTATVIDSAKCAAWWSQPAHGSLGRENVLVSAVL